MFWTSAKKSKTTTTITPTTHNSGITTYNLPSTGANSSISVNGFTGSNSSVFITAGGGGSGGYGTTNSVLTSGGMWATMPSTWTSSGTHTTNNTVSITGTVNLDSDEPSIKTKKHLINLDELFENIQILNEMFSVIVPNNKKMNENPTLKDAYEQYNNAKLIEPKYNSEEYRTAYEQYKLLETLTKEQDDNSKF